MKQLCTVPSGQILDVTFIQLCDISWPQKICSYTAGNLAWPWVHTFNCGGSLTLLIFENFLSLHFCWCCMCITDGCRVDDEVTEVEDTAICLVFVCICICIYLYALVFVFVFVSQMARGWINEVTAVEDTAICIRMHLYVFVFISIYIYVFVFVPQVASGWINEVTASEDTAISKMHLPVS